MKHALVLCATVLAVSVCRAETTVSALKSGHILALNEVARVDLEAASVALLESCDYEAQNDVATDSRWQRVSESDHVELKFSTPKIVQLVCSTTGPARKQTVICDEVLIPVVGRFPDYVLVLSQSRVRAFAKYHAVDQAEKLHKIIESASQE
jgi:hypothetical protein